MVRRELGFGLLLTMASLAGCGSDDPAGTADTGTRDIGSDDAGASALSGTGTDAGHDAQVPAAAGGAVAALASVPLMELTPAQARTLCEFRRAEQHRAYADEASLCNQFGGKVGETLAGRSSENPTAKCMDVVNMCKSTKAFASLLARIDAVDCASFTVADLHVNDTWRCAAKVGDLTTCWTESANNLSTYGAKVSCDDPSTFESAATSLPCREWADQCYGLNYWDVRVPS